MKRASLYCIATTRNIKEIGKNFRPGTRNGNFRHLDCGHHDKNGNCSDKKLIDGRTDVSPIKLTAIQSGLAVIVASVLATVLFELVGTYFHSVWYQLFATLVVASIVAPVFLYPSFKTS